MENTALHHSETERLVEAYLRTRDPELRTRIIERHENLVRSVAHKFTRPGVPVEDLIQAAWIALIGALDRFDPERATRFSTYAVHCMVGEIKRYFRDRTWSIKVPRQLQEIAANLGRMQDELYARLEREPTVPEMAQSFGISEETLLEAMEVGAAYQPLGLDDRYELNSGSEGMPLYEAVGQDDPHLGIMVEQAPLYRAMESLDDRRRQVLQMRFFDGHSQQEVADVLGVSQMQVSRLERSALKMMREAMSEAAP